MSPTIGASFIFRDHLEDTRRMLCSLMPHVDEIVAVDTGSTDGTRELVEAAIANKRGRVVDHPWNDHFSDARNAGWRLLESDWNVWLDCDETVFAPHQLLRAAVEEAEHLGIEGYISPQTTSGLVTFLIARLVKRTVGWAWETPLNEHLVPSRRVVVRYADHFHFIHHRRGLETDRARNIRIESLYPRTTLEWRKSVLKRFQWYDDNRIVRHDARTHATLFRARGTHLFDESGQPREGFAMDTPDPSRRLSSPVQLGQASIRSLIGE